MIETKQEELHRLRHALQKAQSMVRMVRAKTTIYPGVEISIRGHTIAIDRDTGPATVTLVGDRIEILAYQEREFSSEEEVDE